MDGLRLGVTTLLTVALAGCGEYYGAAEEVGVPESEQHADEGRLARDSSEIDPGADPSDPLPRADIVSGNFEVLSSAPADYADIDGQAYLAHDAAGGTTVTVRLGGLEPRTEYVAHLHEQSCADGDGGDHFAFDPEGEAAPPNEIHIPFTSDGDGSTDTTVTNDVWVEDRAPSVVVHEVGDDTKLACADFDAER